MGVCQGGGNAGGVILCAESVYEELLSACVAGRSMQDAAAWAHACTCVRYNKAHEYRCMDVIELSPTSSITDTADAKYAA